MYRQFVWHGMACDVEVQLFSPATIPMRWVEGCWLVLSCILSNFFIKSIKLRCIVLMKYKVIYLIPRCVLCQIQSFLPCWYSYKDLNRGKKLCALVRIGVRPYRPMGMLCQDQLSTSSSQIQSWLDQNYIVVYVHHATGVGLWLTYTRVYSRHTRHTALHSIQPLLECWANIKDGGPTLKQHWLNASCLLGYQRLFHRWPIA